ncbi:MAG TPA: PEP-CTERM sorting domain-containing protein [Candidatus Sulfotelmatobacter sp.]|nr:PEP-CTERM sorting domain-containing protein [Candidatus Sulfotelmatobacter sp.]
MKKQIAILATILAASAVTSFAQDYISFEVSSKTVWDDFSGTPMFDAAGAGNIDAILLWAPVGTADDLTSQGTSFGLRGTGTALDQVATNATSVINPVGTITNMLSSGWNIAEDAGNGNALAVATEASGLATGQVGYNSGNPFEINGVTLATGSSIEEIVLAYNSSATSWSTASDYGWSNPFDNEVGTSTGDPNATELQSSANQFGVAVVTPEPATIALAGLGGLSMLFLRRRKA